MWRPLSTEIPFLPGRMAPLRTVKKVVREGNGRLVHVELECRHLMKNMLSNQVPQKVRCGVCRAMGKNEQ